MLTKIRSKLTYANVGVTIALVIGLGGFAVAAIPNANGVFTGCITSAQTQSVLRVIDESTQQCAADEQRITWNQQGVQGPTGATGAQGPQGPAGATGKQGPPGAVFATTSRARPLGMAVELPKQPRQKVLTVDPGPGSYFVVGSAEFSWFPGSYRRDGRPTMAREFQTPLCYLVRGDRPNSDNVDKRGPTVGNDQGSAWVAPVTLSGVIRVTGQQVIAMRCQGNSDETLGHMSIGNWSLSAVSANQTSQVTLTPQNYNP